MVEPGTASPTLKPGLQQALGGESPGAVATAVIKAPGGSGPLTSVQFSEKLATQMGGLSLDGQALDMDMLGQRTSADTSLNSAPTPAQLPPGVKAQLSVMTPFQQSGQWGQAVAERVVWMNGQEIKEAEIHLDPPELGPIQVKVSMVNEQAHVSFVVQHASVREALDQSAMRLRELFDGEGINLVDVDVSDQSQQQGGDAEDADGHAEGGEPLVSTQSALGAEGGESVTTLSLSGEGYSLVNTFA